MMLRTAALIDELIAAHVSFSIPQNRDGHHSTGPRRRGI